MLTMWIERVWESYKARYKDSISTYSPHAQDAMRITFTAGFASGMMYERRLAEQPKLQPDADGWLPNPGYCPVDHDTPMTLRFSDWADTFVYRPRNWRWEAADRPNDITHYKIA